MAITAEIKKTAADTGYAMVGVTDLAVEQVRNVRTELGVRKVTARVQHAPTAAVNKGIEAAGKVEETYDDLTARGRKLVSRIRRQRATQDLAAQARATVSRTKGAVTSVRRGTARTKSAAKATATTAQREAGQTATATKRAVRKNTTNTQAAAKRTATTASKRSTAAKSATKSATTSARKTATAAMQATQAAASKVGD